MGCANSSSSKNPDSTGQNKTEIVGTENPKSGYDLKTCLKLALKDDRMVLLEMGNKEKQWTDTLKNSEKKIVMVDCKTLQNDQLNQELEEEENVDDYKDNRSIESILNSLQQRIGSSPTLKIELFTNWGRTQRAKVISCYPTSKDEIQSLVQAAAAEDVRVRCVGSRHSWAPLFSDDRQLLIHVAKMESDYSDGSRIRLVNKKRMEVDIMTGITTGDFKEFQIKNKMHLDANVILDMVQMVSVVATACHGVGQGTKSPSDHIVKMRIFDSKGELRTYTMTDNKDMFRAVAGNFGCFGVIFDMTIQLVPEIIVKTENVYYDLEDLFFNPASMKSLVENNWSVEIFWFPYNSLSVFDYEPKNDDIWVRVINKVKNPKSVDLAEFSYYSWKDAKDSLTQEALQVVAPFIASDPGLTPYYAWSAFKALKHIIYPAGHLHQELPHAVHFRKYVDQAPVSDMEFAFDLKGDYNKLLKIIQIVVSKVDHYEEKDEYPLNLALEMRWMGYSDTYLCPGIIGNPAYGGSGQVFYVEILSVQGTRGWEKFCIDVGKEWMALGGVPHLAKQWDFLPNIENHIHKIMGLPFSEFKTQLLKSGADPDGMFLNERLKKLFRL